MPGTRIYALVIAIVVILAIVATLWVYANPPTKTITFTKEKTFTVTEVQTEVATKTEVLTKVATSLVVKEKTATMVKTLTKVLTKVKTEVVRYPMKIVDALGRTVEIASEPKRVVSLSPAITEILFALGLGDRVVGVDSFSNYPPEVVELKRKGKIVDVGGYWNPDFEKIASLKPDLVIVEIGAHAKYREKFEELNLKVLYVRGGGARSLSDVYLDIGLIAHVFGVDDKAKELVNSIAKTVDTVVEKLRSVNASKPRVLLLLGPPTYGFWTMGGGTFLDELVSLAGGINVFHDKYGWIQVSREEIVARDPQIIIVSMMGSAGDAKAVLKQIVEDEALSQTTAVKEKRVYVVTGEANDILMRPGPRIDKAIEILAHIIHPEIFGEIKRGDVYTYEGSLGFAIELIGIEVKTPCIEIA